MPKKYGIESVARALGLRFKGKADKDSLYYYCPFCNDTKGKLNINIKGNIWRCNKCGEGGGVIQLVEYFRECSRNEALDWLQNNPEIEIWGNNDTYSEIKDTKPDIADEDTLDRTYRALLSLLKLEDTHRADLHRRGLSDKAIERFNFKSMPSKERGIKIAEYLLKQGYVLKGVPGFYTAYNIWQMQDLPGYLVPFINVNGKITGMQIRTDNPGERNAKYMSLTSTGKTNGTKSSLEAHLVGYKNQDKIFITEGALKSDIASYLAWKGKHNLCAFLAIPGVNNTKSLNKALGILKEKGVKTVYNCFDMDREGNKDCEVNPQVKKAVNKIERIVKEAGFEWKSLSWDYEKGIDDYELLLYENSRD